MRVKCLHSKIETQDKNIINNDMTDYILPGTILEVYGIRITKKLIYYYVYSDGHLFEVPSKLFEIIDGNLTTSLVYKIWENEDITIWPTQFYEIDFIDNFSEWMPKEREEFSKLLAKKERQKP